MSLTLWTIGHSIRSIEEFLGLLQAHGIRLLVDVRTIPYSRRNPQFNTGALERSLAQASLRYRHLPALGGRRKARPDSINQGWRNASFRGYADYMQTEAFWKGLDELLQLAKAEPTVIMCAEAVPWRCHRSLIADALVSRGWIVRHIISLSRADEHRRTEFARVEDGRITYPPLRPLDSPSRLF